MNDQLSPGDWVETEFGAGLVEARMVVPPGSDAEWLVRFRRTDLNEQGLAEFTGNSPRRVFPDHQLARLAVAPERIKAVR